MPGLHNLLTQRRSPGVKVILFLIAVAGLASTARAAGLEPLSPWPMFHRDGAHSGRSTNAVPSTGTLAWSCALSDTVEFSSPVVGADGTIYIGDQGKELWALWPWGIAKWNYHTGGNLRYSTPAVGADSTVYIGSADGKLYAIRTDGTLKWAVPTGGAVKTSPAIGGDGTIYIGSDDGRLWALAGNGGVRWTFVAGDTIRSSPAIGPDGTIYFGCNNGNLYAVWPTGIQRWAGATGGPIKGSPAVDGNGNVIVGSGDGFLYSITSAGVLNWAISFGQNLRGSPAVGVTGKIYLGVNTKIVAYHSNGTPAWDYDTLARVYGTPCVYTAPDLSELVYCGSDNGSFYAMNYGVAVWSQALGSPVRSSPSISGDGHILVASMAGLVHSFGSPYTAGVDANGGPAAGPRLVVSPNPMSREDALRIRLADASTASGRGRVAVYEAGGRLIFSKPLPEQGDVVWNGADATGRSAPSGVYLIRWSDGRISARSRVVRVR